MRGNLNFVNNGLGSFLGLGTIWRWDSISQCKNRHASLCSETGQLKDRQDLVGRWRCLCRCPEPAGGDAGAALSDTWLCAGVCILVWPGKLLVCHQ